MLKLERAFDHLISEGVELKSLIIGGGVAANSRLRADVQRFAEAKRVPALIPPMQLCVDNAAMIAALGARMCALDDAQSLDLDATARVGS
jgi:N6-L-threonylcarbamoyladenine synthase